MYSVHCSNCCNLFCTSYVDFCSISLHANVVYADITVCINVIFSSRAIQFVGCLIQ